MSLRFELGTLREAINGARMLADLVANDAAQSASDASRAPHARSAVLALVEARMRLLDLAIVGEAGWELLMAPHNGTTVANATQDRQDLVMALADKG